MSTHVSSFIHLADTAADTRLVIGVVNSFVRLNCRRFGMRWTALRREQQSARQTSHGHAARESAEYQTWAHIRQRCLNPPEEQ